MPPAHVSVAVAPPGSPDFAADAVIAGGARLVPPAEADALVWMGADAPLELHAVLQSAPHIRWVQLPWAGVEVFAAADIFKSHGGIVWTSGKGVYADEVAEHAMALTLACLRGVPDAARRTSWGGDVSGRSLFGRRVCILGAGGVAQSFIRLAAPFRCHVTVVRRTSGDLGGADRVVRTDQLPGILCGADVLVLALALTPATVGIIGDEALSLLPPGAVLVNVARGEHVDTDALVAAIRSGHLGGAGVDVTDPEPLPAGHELFAMRNVVVTPHRAITVATAERTLRKRIEDNVRFFALGQPLVGVVDPSAGY